MTNKKFHRQALSASLLMSLTVASAANAHEGAADANTTAYGAEFFAVFKPVTLSDMIRHVSGGVTLLANLERMSRSGRGGRGFGASGAQILLNGKRMPGKANDMGKTLARIQASQVDHIDLIRGTSEGLDIRSEGVLINVILKEGAADKSSTFVEAKMERRPSMGVMPGVLVSHNSSKGAFKYGGSYQHRNWARVHNMLQDTFNSDGAPIEFDSMRRVERDLADLFTGNVSYAFDNGDSISLNALYSDTTRGAPRFDNHYDIALDGTQTFVKQVDRDWTYNDKKWEFGGDYEGEAGALGRLKALFIVTNTTNKDIGIEDDIIDDIRTRDFSFNADYTQKERIARAGLTKSFGEGHTLEYGAEGAFNRLDKTTLIDLDPATSTQVSEDRYEIFATHSWTISPKLSLQSALTEEFSTIEQTTVDVTNRRSFKYLKPRVELRYDVSKADQLRFVADRKVSQLNLNNFIVSRNTHDDTTDYGNPDLEPFKLWTYTLGYEHQFGDNAGSIEAKVFYEDYADHIDKIQIGDTSSGVGNIGDASRYGLDIKAHARLGFIGVPNAMLTVNYHYKDSDATDPFTGENRQIKHTTRNYWTMDFQHDLTDMNVTYGMNMHYRASMPRQDITLRSVRSFKRHLSLYAEYKLRDNMKIRAETNHVLGDGKMYQKTFYVGHIADNIVKYNEYRSEKAEFDHSLTLQITF